MLESQVRVRALERFSPCLVPAGPRVGRAHDLAVTLTHPVYDMIYLALAEREDAIVVTADERLVRALMNTRWAAYVELL